MDKSKLSLIGLIVGIVGALFTILGMIPSLFFFGFIAPIMTLFAIIAGALTLKSADGSANGKAIAALIVGIIFLVIGIPVFICDTCYCKAACVANDLYHAANTLNSWLS